MKRIRNLSGSTGIVIGILVTLILVPTAAVAAANFTVVRVKGPSGQAANVTHNSQLLTTEADPTSYQVGIGHLLGNTVGNCVVIAAPPAGKALIIDHVILGNYVTPPQVTSPSAIQAAEAIDLTVDSAANPCDGFIGATISISTVAGPGTETISLAPGYAVPPGYQLNLRFGLFSSASNTFATAYGYTVPANDVAATPQDALRGHKADFKRTG